VLEYSKSVFGLHRRPRMAHGLPIRICESTIWNVIRQPFSSLN
jgi:hypothetical protein